MDIIVVGCGKVGFTIVEQLSNEGHNIIAIDERQERIDKVKEELDVIGIVGNGVSYQVLMDAGITTAKSSLLPYRKKSWSLPDYSSCKKSCLQRRNRIF